MFKLCLWVFVPYFYDIAVTFYSGKIDTTYKEAMDHFVLRPLSTAVSVLIPG